MKRIHDTHSIHIPSEVGLCVAGVWVWATYCLGHLSLARTPQNHSASGFRIPGCPLHTCQQERPEALELYSSVLPWPLPAAQSSKSRWGCLLGGRSDQSERWVGARQGCFQGKQKEVWRYPGALFPAQCPKQAAHRGRREHGHQGSEEPGLFSLSAAWGGPGGKWVKEGVGLIPIRRGRP